MSSFLAKKCYSLIFCKKYNLPASLHCTVWITPAFARLQIFTALAHPLGGLPGVSLLRCRSSINAF